MRFAERERSQEPHQVLDPHYLHPRLVALYDHENPWAADTDFYLSLAPKTPIDILDLGCGTGLLATAFAQKGHRVIGLDPSQEMLDCARQKSAGERVKWVRGRAQEFASETHFDLIVMTGHAFQVQLRDVDVKQALQGMRTHLKPGGMVAFESRNPLCKPWLRWVPEHSSAHLELPSASVQRHIETLAVEGEYVTFRSVYRFADETYYSESTLRFMRHADIVEAAESAGLQLRHTWGDWDRSPIFADAPEMIFVFRAELNHPS